VQKLNAYLPYFDIKQIYSTQLAYSQYALQEMVPYIAKFLYGGKEYNNIHLTSQEMLWHGLKEIQIIGKVSSITTAPHNYMVQSNDAEFESTTETLLDQHDRFNGLDVPDLPKGRSSQKQLTKQKYADRKISKKLGRSDRGVALVAHNHATISPDEASLIDKADRKYLDKIITIQMQLASNPKLDPAKLKDIICREKLTGPVFEEYEYEKVELNEGLSNLLWENVPDYLYNMRIMRYKCANESERAAQSEFQKLLSAVSDFNINSASRSEIHSLKKLLIFIYSKCSPAMRIDEKEHDFQLFHYKFWKHPELRFPNVDPAHFVGKVTSRKVTLPLFEHNCDNTQTNILFDMLKLMDATAKRMTPIKIKSLCRDAMKNKQDPVEIVTHQCPIWTEKDFIVDNTENNTPFTNKLLRKLSWMVPYIPSKWLTYHICVDDPKAKSLRVKYQRYFTWLRSMVVNLRDSLISFAEVYQQIGALPNYEKATYRKSIKNSFERIMQTPDVQTMYMMGASKESVTEHIFQKHMRDIKAKVLKTDLLLEIKNTRKISGKLMLARQRDDKREVQEFDCYRDEVQSNDLYWETDKELFMRESIGLLLMAYVFFVVYLLYCLNILWMPMFDERFWHIFAAFRRLFRDTTTVQAKPETKWGIYVMQCCYFLVVDNYLDLGLTRMARIFIHYMYGRFQAFLSGLYWLLWLRRQREYVSNSIPSYIASSITDVSNFMTNTNTVMAPHTVIFLTELNACINVAYSYVSNDIPGALRHASYLAITRANMLKEIIVGYGGSKAPDPKYSLIHRGKTVLVSMDQYLTYTSLTLNTSIKDKTVVLDAYFASLHKDETQAVGDTFAWFKPISQFASMMTFGDMTEKDIRDANAQYQYLNHKSKFVNDSLATTQMIISVISRFIFGFDPFDVSYQQFVTDCLTIVYFVEQHYKNRRLLQGDKDLMEKILSYEPLVMAMMQDARMAVLPSYLRTHIVRRFKEMEVLIHASHSFLHVTHVRQTPVSVFFTGKPGVGKSQSMEFARKILSTVLKYPQGPESKYIFNPDNEFHEGYVFQPFVYCDDMFKHSDVKKREVESTNMINMINTIPFNMPMAFESKGQVNFDSPWVFSSTNFANNGIVQTQWQIGLIDPQAFLRRLHLVLHKDTPAARDVGENLFRIDKCDVQPDLVGTMIRMKDVPELLLRTRKWIHDYEQLGAMSELDMRNIVPNLDTLYDTYKTPSDEKRLFRPIDQVQSGKPKRDFIDEMYDEEDDGLIPPVSDSPWFSHSEEEDARDEEMSRRILEVGLPQRKLSNDQYINEILNIKCTDYDPNDPNTPKKINFYTMLFYAIIIITTIASVYYFWRSYETQSHSYKDARGRRAKKGYNNILNQQAMARTVRAMKVGSVDKTQSNDTNYMLSLVNRVSRCVVVFTAGAFDDDGYIEKSGNETEGFHYANGVFCTPAHLITKYNDYPGCYIKITVKHMGGHHTVTSPIIYRLDGEDMCFFRIEGMTQLPASLRKYVWQEKDVFPIEEGTPMNLLSLTCDLEPNVKPVTKAKQCGPLEYNDKQGNLFQVNFCINYYERTHQGESGSLVAICGQQGQVKITGFHVCLRESFSQKNFGFALAFTREGLDKILEEAGMLDISTVQSRHSEIPFEPLRIVPDNEAHYPPVRNTIRETQMFEWAGPATCAPVRLTPFVNSDGDLIDPLLLSLEKVRTVHTPETPMPETCLDYLLHIYPPPLEGSGVLTWDESLSGIPGTDILSINVGTSAGYPGNLKHKKGKSYFIQVDGDKFSYEPEFLEELILLEQSLLQGEQIEVIWALALKLELRPIAKVLAGKTRSFQICPVHYLILGRRYFGRCLAAIKAAAGDAPCAVGLNVHSPHWTSLYHRLNSTAGSVIAGDFENWDGSICKFVALIVVKFFNKWYDDGPQNATVRDLLCQHLYEAVHICYNTIYQTCGSGPTGNFMTSEWNSLVQITENYTILTEDFKLKVGEFEMVVYGDDNIITTKTKGLRCSDFAVHYKRRFNQIYTHFTKTAVDPYDTLETVSFIGRKFVVDENGMYRAPLEHETINEMCYWNKGAISDEIQLLTSVDTMFAEWAHYPKDVWAARCVALLRAVHKFYPQMYDAVRSKRLMYSMYIDRMYYSGNSKIEYKIQSKDVKFIEGNFKPVEENQAGDTDRAVKESIPTEYDQLGALQDVAPITETMITTNGIQEPQNAPNMETFDFEKSLDRAFQVAAITCTTTQAAGTLLQQFDLPAILFAETYISQKLNDFNAFTCSGVEFSFRMTSSRTYYGKFMAVFYPFQKYYAVEGDATEQWTPPTNIYHITGHPHILFSASSSDVVTWRLPFVTPFRYLDLAKYGDSEIGLVRVYVMDPLTNTVDATAHATILTTARFIDAKVWLPTDTVFGVSLMARRQMTSEQFDEAKQNLKSGATKPDIRVNGSHRFTIQSKSVNYQRTTKNKEGAKKAMSVTADKEVFNPVKSFVDTVKLVGNTMGNVATNVIQGVMVGAILGLSKPTTTNYATITTPNPNFNTNNGNGISTVMKTALDSENTISVTPNVGGISADEMTIAMIATTPSLVAKTTLTPSSPARDIMSTGIDINFTFCDHLKMMHYYWYGSHKCKVYITASIFHDVRLVFYLARDVAADWMVCYHKIVEIQGDTDVEMTIPYCAQGIATPTVTNEPPYTLFVKILTWSQNDFDIVLPIYLNTYKAAASDFQVGAPKDVRYVIQSNPRVDFNQDFEALHPSMTGYGQDGLIFGEKIDTLRTLVHRLHPIQTMSLPDAEPIVRTSVVSGTNCVGLSLYRLFYRFWRGSVRFKAMRKKDAATYSTGLSFTEYDSLIAYTNGISLPAPGLNFVEGEIPYYSPVLFDNTQSPPMVPRYYATDNTDRTYMLKSGGDDFSFHWLILPLGGHYEYNTGSDEMGYAGLQAFYAT
jgi:hypothetical protein